jgi:transcriptional regulator with XRE-family HTH domain
MSRHLATHVDSAHALGGRLRDLREEAGLSQRQLAFRTGCTPSFVSRLEKGERIPSLQYLDGCAAALNATKLVSTSSAYLARGEDTIVLVLDAAVINAIMRSWTNSRLGWDDLSATERGRLHDDLLQTARRNVGPIALAICQRRLLTEGANGVQADT